MQPELSARRCAAQRSLSSASVLHAHDFSDLVPLGFFFFLSSSSIFHFFSPFHNTPARFHFLSSLAAARASAVYTTEIMRPSSRALICARSRGVIHHANFIPARIRLGVFAYTRLYGPALGDFLRLSPPFNSLDSARLLACLLALLAAVYLYFLAE